MEALSPRSTNVPPRTKVTVKRAKLEKENAPMQKSQSSKSHAPPPPPLVTEPGEDGESYTTGAFLGKGGFAVCYEGKLKRNGRAFALKVVRSEMNQKKMAEKFRTELQIHSKMRHPNIVEFHRAFSFEQSTYVVLEICPNGSVMDMVRKRKSLSLPEVRRFMVQLCGAVKYLHKRKVAHRDLKMGNLFLDVNMDIKVGDFGLAAIIITEKDAETARRRTLCGTPNYIAPEVLDKSKGGHTQKVDIWSLGVICFAMLTGYPPFQSKTQEEIYKKVRDLNYVWPKDSDRGNYIPAEAKGLVSSCLSLSEEERPEPDEIVDHEFFNMYSGCIPGSLDPACRFSKPEWLKHEDPCGDRMYPGYSLASDRKYSAKTARLKDPEQQYALCKNEFYAESGVGKAPSGHLRRAVGKNCSKTAYSECVAEDERGMQPMIPLPEDQVYKHHLGIDGDWSLGREVVRDEYSVDDVLQENLPPKKRSVSSRNQGVPTARTQAALAAQLRRKEGQPQSHAATLRQQALPPRESSKTAATVRIPQALSQAAPEAIQGRDELRRQPIEQQGLGGRPIRTRARAAQTNSASLREKEKAPAPPLPQASTVSGRPTAPRTRSQSKQPVISEGNQVYPAPRQIKEDEKIQPGPEKKTSLPHIRAEDEMYQTMRSVYQNTMKSSRPHLPGSADVQPSVKQQQQIQARIGHGQRGTSSSSSKSGSSTATNKSRSTLGISPLIHPYENAEILPGSSPNEVLAEIRLMLADINQRPSPSTVEKQRRRYQSPSSRQVPHPYVVKWVDYTNRYGIGYVLDEGSVGCVFKAENGHPASCVVVRDGERHIRRKARSQEQRQHEDYGWLNAYSESNQLVPRDGKPVEFYESYGSAACSDLQKGIDSGDGGIRRVLVAPKVFEVKSSSNGSGSGGIKVRMNGGVESAKCEAEKVKRIKLVDQFGKYMIGSLGRAGEDPPSAPEQDKRKDGQYIKFYQRLGNVGVWGFGDGAFQFNFPDHTKLVLSRRQTDISDDSTSSHPAAFTTWVDFYHLSPRAAQYLAAKGRMHPAGFDTRAVSCDEIGAFLDAASNYINSGRVPADERLSGILHANSFLEKIRFVSAVLEGWVDGGRLGEMPSPSASSCSLPSSSSSGSLSSATNSVEKDSLFFWDGVQEGSIASNSSVSTNNNNGKSGVTTKFVWVTVGAQGGDREYLSMSLDLPLDLRQRRVNSERKVEDGLEGQELRNKLRDLALS